MTTDFRDLCAALADALTAHGPVPAALPLLIRARAALAESIDCVACEDKPAPGNSPCSLCGRTAQPQPPADGEVGELVWWLRATASRQTARMAQEQLTRAADLLEQLAATGKPGLQVKPTDEELDELYFNLDATEVQSWRAFARAVLARWGNYPAQPIPVSERLPEAGIKVLAHYLNPLGKGRTICAIWVPTKWRSDEKGDEDFTEYDEDDDKFYWPEGWYEAIENWDEYESVQVYEGEVIYWQPLPQWPAHALPVPCGEVEC